MQVGGCPLECIIERGALIQVCLDRVGDHRIHGHERLSLQDFGSIGSTQRRSLGTETLKLLDDRLRCACHRVERCIDILHDKNRLVQQ